MILLLKAILGMLTGLFSLTYFRDVVRNRPGKPSKAMPARFGIGFITNFLDTLGIGSFAQQTALFKFFRLVDDRLIPGTMNVGDTIPTVIQAFIFMTVVDIDKITLTSVAAAASMGALLGAGVVARLSRQRIQTGMGIGLLLVGFIILAGLLNLLPLGGEATGLEGLKLMFMVTMSFVFGALQTIGVGFYAPCMAMVFALGMHPLTAFPLMMTSTALLMLAGSAQFIKKNSYDRQTAVALSVAGAAGVFVAAYLIKALPLVILKWIVGAVVFYTSVSMLRSARKPQETGHSVS